MRAGDIGFSRIGGLLGWFISLAQWITGDACRFTHVFLVLDDETVLEAMPAGARIAPLAGRKPQDGFFYYSRLPLTEEQRIDVVAEARKLVGVKYSFLNYPALALLHLGIAPKWLRNYVTNSNRMICSQLVDYVYCKAGIKLFNDGRLSQDVTPGDLFYGVAERYGESQIV